MRRSEAHTIVFCGEHPDATDPIFAAFRQRLDGQVCAIVDALHRTGNQIFRAGRFASAESGVILILIHPDDERTQLGGFGDAS